MTIHLCGVGEKPAKPAYKIKSGDILIWNYGYKSIVKSITKTKSGKSMDIIEQYMDGKVYKRRLSKNTLVAIGG